MAERLTILHTESSLGWGGQEHRTFKAVNTSRTPPDHIHRLVTKKKSGAWLYSRAHWVARSWLGHLHAWVS